MPLLAINSHLTHLLNGIIYPNELSHYYFGNRLKVNTHEIFGI